MLWRTPCRGSPSSPSYWWRSPLPCPSSSSPPLRAGGSFCGPQEAGVLRHSLYGSVPASMTRSRTRSRGRNDARSTTIEIRAYQTDVPLLGVHLGLPEILGIGGEPCHRAPRPLGSGVKGEQLARHPQALGHGLGVRSKIGNLLSMRGITLCRWKFAMTAAAVSPFFTKCCSASVNTSSLACCFGGDTPNPMCPASPRAPCR